MCWAFIPVVGPESQSLVPTTMLAKTGRDLQKKKKKDSWMIDRLANTR